MPKNRYLDLAYVYFVRDFNDLAKDKTYTFQSSPDLIDYSTNYLALKPLKLYNYSHLIKTIPKQ